MHHPHNFVVVGDNSKSPARFSTQLQPIKLDQNVGMAINSIFHGSIHNITSENQHVTYEVDIFKIPDSSTGILIPTEDVALGEDSIIKRVERVRESFKLQMGNYSSTLSILRVIASWFKEQFPSDDDDEEWVANSGGRRGGRFRGRVRVESRDQAGYEISTEAAEYIDRDVRRIKPDKPLRLEIDESSLDEVSEGFIKITPRNMSLIIDKTTPWGLIGLASHGIIRKNKTLQVRNIIFSKTIEPAFLYSNIVENSYINGKLSRNLATIPLSLRSGWNFYEFKHPVYVPIDVKEFSKIILELRDMNGKPIQFDSSFKTILNLHIKPINRAGNLQ